MTTDPAFDLFSDGDPINREAQGVKEDSAVGIDGSFTPTTEDIIKCLIGLGTTREQFLASKNGIDRMGHDVGLVVRRQRVNVERRGSSSSQSGEPKYICPLFLILGILPASWYKFVTILLLLYAERTYYS